MKKLKKTRAKLRSGEKIVGKGVPDCMLNQERIKKLKQLNSKTAKKRRK
ncbi:hypothetical protein [Aureispira sp. CCB-QB1]|nr:hypothetical protein [Aureispira sp. CCB-QB1]